MLWKNRHIGMACLHPTLKGCFAQVNWYYTAAATKDIRPNIRLLSLHCWLYVPGAKQTCRARRTGLPRSILFHRLEKERFFPIIFGQALHLLSVDNAWRFWFLLCRWIVKKLHKPTVIGVKLKSEKNVMWGIHAFGFFSSSLGTPL